MSDTTTSGRFLVRLDPGLHARLRADAAAAGVSLNELCSRRLAVPDRSTDALLARAAVEHGASLRAVIAFGSWARGNARVASDVDVLVVLERAVPLDRSLYRRWDREPMMLEGHIVEPHLTHLPDGDARPSGLWCEVAVEGLLLYDRDLETSRYLASVRLRIASGEVTRRLAHGQPYWAGAA